MKGKNISPWILHLYIFLCAGCTSSPEEVPLKFDFNSTSYISLTINEVLEPFDFQWSYFPSLSNHRPKTPIYHVSGDTTVLIEIITHLPQKHSFSIKEVKFPVFITIQDTLQVNLNLKSGSVEYSGAYKNINEYYATNHQELTRNSFEYVNLFSDPKTPWAEIYKQMDEMAGRELQLLTNTKIDLPKWFKELEVQKILFSNADWKLSGPNYRNAPANDSMNILDEKSFAFIKELDLQSPYNKFLFEYYGFMHFYSFYKVYGKNYVISDSINYLYQNKSQATTLFKIFEGEVSEANLLAFETQRIMIDIASNSIFKEARLSYMTNKYSSNNVFVKYLEAEEAKREVLSLKNGDRAPEFYLNDGSGVYHTLSEQEGNVVLLNFFTRGCVGCFIQVPFEKELQKKYHDANFTIINICITSSATEFEKAVTKFQMDGLNLFTQENWVKSLRDKYYIVGFPHYALIDQKGKIIMNHAFPPSNPKLEKLIDDHLKDGTL